MSAARVGMEAACVALCVALGAGGAGCTGKGAPARSAVPTLSVAEIQRGDAAQLEGWARHPGLAPELRVVALARLEEVDPAAAVGVAVDLVRGGAPEPEGLLRNNAVAVLSRSPDPRAALALRDLQGKARHLAGALKAAEGRERGAPPRPGSAGGARGRATSGASGADGGRP